MIKAKSNRKARRLFGLTHWKNNKFRVSFTETADGGKWKVVKKNNTVRFLAKHSGLRPYPASAAPFDAAPGRQPGSCRNRH